MAAALSVIVAKDGAGSTVVGGLQYLDLSGGATGPWVQTNVIVDGIAGLQRATVKAASTAAVATDTSLVVAINPNSVNANGQATMANSAPVVIASDQSTLTTKIKASTGTQSIVVSASADTSLLAANSARLGGTIFNDSTQILYLLAASATSSSTVYTVQLTSNSYYELPFGYAGVVKGTWVTANGNARITEFTA